VTDHGFIGADCAAVVEDVASGAGAEKRLDGVSGTGIQGLLLAGWAEDAGVS
jgi:hypothetical protein